jgi:hypothetical protein
VLVLVGQLIWFDFFCLIWFGGFETLAGWRDLAWAAITTNTPHQKKLKKKKKKKKSLFFFFKKK